MRKQTNMKQWNPPGCAWTNQNNSIFPNMLPSMKPTEWSFPELDAGTTAGNPLQSGEKHIEKPWFSIQIVPVCPTISNRTSMDKGFSPGPAFGNGVQAPCRPLGQRPSRLPSHL